jgi:hypothetical protein
MGAEIRLGQIWRCNGPGNEWEIVSLNPIRGRWKKLGPTFAGQTGRLGEVSTFWEDPPGVGWTLVFDAPEAAPVPRPAAGQLWRCNTGGRREFVLERSEPGGRGGQRWWFDTTGRIWSELDGTLPNCTLLAPAAPPVAERVPVGNGITILAPPEVFMCEGCADRPAVNQDDTGNEQLCEPCIAIAMANLNTEFAEKAGARRAAALTDLRTPHVPGDSAVAANLGRREWRRR